MSARTDDGLIKLEGLDKEKFERLEARISSNGENGVTTLEFDSAQITRKSVDSTRSMSSNGVHGNNNSCSSSVSRTVHGIEKISAPGSGFDPEENKVVPDSPIRAPVREASSASNISNVSRRSNEPKRRGDKTFSKDEDSEIMQVIFFQRSKTTMKKLSIKLGLTEEDVMARYKHLMKQAAEVDSLDKHNVALDLLSRQSAISRLSNGSGSNSQSEVRTKASSPSVSTSLKNALKNQPRIKQFFIPVNQAEKRKRLDDPPSLNLIGKTASPMNVASAGVALDTTVSGTTDAILSTGTKLSSSGTTLKRQKSSLSMSLNTSEFERQLRDKEREIEKLRATLKAQEEERAKVETLYQVKHSELEQLRSETKELHESYRCHRDRVAKVLEELLRKSDAELHRHQRKTMGEEGFRLGRVVVQKHGFGPRTKFTEIWVDGDAFRVNRQKQLELLQRREELERTKKQITKAARHRKSIGTGSDLDEIEVEEFVKAQMVSLKRTEQELADDRAKLDMEKVLLLRNVQRLRSEESSRFCRQPVLHNRYLLRDLLGKGGFSEVWKAYDLHELRDVAVKVHELNSSWSEVKKTSYLKHATREYEIHLSLMHPRIVQLFDVFEIDTNSFATVLEYCEGYDLETHLRLRKTIAEREARAIILQILNGLRYLSSGGELGEEDHQGGVASSSSSSPFPSPRSGIPPVKQNRSAKRPCIIHYDLKPGNILFDEKGGVKITDFGLSKIMQPADTESTGIELTSQGAGTYWYLPPECFRVGQAPPKISSKVDVWSTGVIFYQMLFGKRPFGEGMTQDKLFSSQTMLRATQVNFPAKSQVSDEAKAFIRRCLTYNQEYRPDVKTLCEDPYVKSKKPR